MRFFQKMYDTRKQYSAVSSSASSFPPKGIINANLTAAEIASYLGWAICNGSNGTPDLSSRFVRESVTGAGSIGGSDASHTHTVPSHGHIMPHVHDINHDHGSFNSGAENSHTHAAGSVAAKFSLDGVQMYMKAVNTDAWAVSARGVQTTTATTGNNYSTGLECIGSTAAGSSHLHAVDVPALGATNSTQPDEASTDGSGVLTTNEQTGSDNRPAYFELVPLMKL
jgi:hypothetical protein